MLASSSPRSSDGVEIPSAAYKAWTTPNRLAHLPLVAAPDPFPAPEAQRHRQPNPAYPGGPEHFARALVHLPHRSKVLPLRQRPSYAVVLPDQRRRRLSVSSMLSNCVSGPHATSNIPMPGRSRDAPANPSRTRPTSRSLSHLRACPGSSASPPAVAVFRQHPKPDRSGLSTPFHRLQVSVCVLPKAPCRDSHGTIRHRSGPGGLGLVDYLRVFRLDLYSRVENEESLRPILC